MRHCRRRRMVRLRSRDGARRALWRVAPNSSTAADWMLRLRRRCPMLSAHALYPATAVCSRAPAAPRHRSTAIPRMAGRIGRRCPVRPARRPRPPPAPRSRRASISIRRPDHRGRRSETSSRLPVDHPVGRRGDIADDGRHAARRRLGHHQSECFVPQAGKHQAARLASSRRTAPPAANRSPAHRAASSRARSGPSPTNTIGSPRGGGGARGEHDALFLIQPADHHQCRRSRRDPPAARAPRR